jgi:hypothetical protein
MSQTSQVQQDSFEKARAAFFGKTIVTSSPSAPGSSTMAPQTEPVRESSAQLAAAAVAS